MAKWQLRSCRVISIPQIPISAKISSLALYHYWGRAPALYRDYIARPRRARRAPARAPILGVARKPNTLVSLSLYIYIYRSPSIFTHSPPAWLNWDRTIIISTSVSYLRTSWRRRDFKKLSVLLALCETNPSVSHWDPKQRTSDAELCCFLFISHSMKQSGWHVMTLQKWLLSIHMV